MISTMTLAAAGQAPRRRGQLNKRTIEAVKFMGRSASARSLCWSQPWKAVERHGAAASRLPRWLLIGHLSAPQSVGLEVMRRLNDLTLDDLRQLEARLACEQQLAIDVTPGAAADIASAAPQ
jgi:hypothetical protein